MSLKGSLFFCVPATAWNGRIINILILLKATHQQPSIDCNKLNYARRNPGQCLVEIEDRKIWYLIS